MKEALPCFIQFCPMVCSSRLATVLEQAIDRQAARQKALADEQAMPLPSVLARREPVFATEPESNHGRRLRGRETYQRNAKARLEQLADFERMEAAYTDRDPVALHEQFWQAGLVSPGGGKYVWNDQWQTMESTVYGHPGQPKTGPALPPVLANILHANFGLTFEDEGLRARLEIDRAAAAAK